MTESEFVMSSPAFAGFLTRPGTDSRPDGELVREYSASGSETAFAELIRRFAPMVWGVCRRTVGHRQDAEDAFQAVFVVLSRKAGSVRPPSAVGGWLHTVAVHTSLRARTMADRRRCRHNPLATEPPAPTLTERADPDVLRALDEEIARLPQPQRAAVALCELGGVSRKDAAVRLGVAEGTLSSRLAAARKTLAARLRGRGVALAAALAMVTTTDAAPAVTSAPSDTVSSLADGAIRAMFLNKLKLTAAGLAALCILSALAAPLLAAPPDGERYQVKAPVKSQPPKEGKLLLWVDEKPQLLKPDGTELESPEAIKKVHLGVMDGNASLSPDGKRLAFLKRGATLNTPMPKNLPPGVVFDNHRTTLHVLDLGEKEAKPLEGMSVGRFEWLGDGSKVYLHGSEIGEGDVSLQKSQAWVCDLATGKRAPLELPANCHPHFAPDGKAALLTEVKTDEKTWHRQIHLWAGGKDDKPTPVMELNDTAQPARFSPDGTRLLCRTARSTYTPQGKGVWDVSDPEFDRLVVIDLATKKQTELRDLKKNAEWDLRGLAWSPDGKRMAYLDVQDVPPNGGRRQNVFRVTVADADGTNAKEVYRTQGGWLMGFDWR